MRRLCPLPILLGISTNNRWENLHCAWYDYCHDFSFYPQLTWYINEQTVRIALPPSDGHSCMLSLIPPEILIFMTFLGFWGASSPFPSSEHNCGWWRSEYTLDNFDNFENWDNWDNCDNWKDSPGDFWDADYNSDHWEPEFMTIIVTWQLRVTLDSIRNSCDVLGHGIYFVIIEHLTFVSDAAHSNPWFTS